MVIEALRGVRIVALAEVTGAPTNIAASVTMADAVTNLPRTRRLPSSHPCVRRLWRPGYFT
jgi:hypothetical protein